MTTDTTPSVDLDAYFDRIGYAGPREATLEVLRDLHRLHPAAIPFEAIDVLLDRGIDISPAAVDAKLIAARRGGYCFEHNGLFKRVLSTLGFHVEGLAARVLWTRPADAPLLSQSHMALRMTLDGEPWLADVGFGGCVLSSPLRMDTPEPQATGHEPFRITPRGSSLLLEVQLDAGWAPVYLLSREAQLDIDYVPRNWFTSTHPDSIFRNNLMVARTTPQGRHTLLNNRYTRRSPDGQMERRVLSADEIEQVLSDTFGLPVESAWRPVIEKAAAASS